MWGYCVFCATLWHLLFCSASFYYCSVVVTCASRCFLMLMQIQWTFCFPLSLIVATNLAEYARTPANVSWHLRNNVFFSFFLFYFVLFVSWPYFSNLPYVYSLEPLQYKSHWSHFVLSFVSAMFCECLCFWLLISGHWGSQWLWTFVKSNLWQ